MGINLASLVRSTGAYRLGRCTVALLFIWAGVNKLLDPEAFAAVIRAFDLVPDGLSKPLAILLPAVEVIAAVGLFFDQRGYLAAIAVLLAFFITILGYGIWMGLDIDCGCFGPPGKPAARASHGLRPSLYRDLAMACGVLYLYWRRRTSKKHAFQE